jgi:anti-sigma regulatory factor (Ser/Thr protein kinase)
VNLPIDLRHDAFVYDSDGSYSEALVPFLLEGVDAGETVLVAAPPANLELLRAGLGSSVEAVTLVDAATFYRSPAATIANYRDHFRDARLTGSGQSRVVGEAGFGSSSRDQQAWVRLESVMNDVFAHEPGWIVCPYDSRRLDESVLDQARCTHRQAWSGTSSTRRATDEYVEPSEYVHAIPLAAPNRPGEELQLDGTSFAEVRDLIRRTCRGVGLDEVHTEDAVVASSEIVANAVIHGGSPARLTIWADEHSIFMEVEDHGSGLTDPLLGFRPPRAGQIGGAGLWIARQLCDEVEILPSASGTTAQLRIGVPG